jgi:hypothetical protein
MTIRIQNLSINPTNVGGIRAGSQATQFKDTFGRANSGDIGTTWGSLIAYGPGGGTFCAPTISANTLLFTQTGAGSTGSVIYPLPLAWMTQVIQNHFCEVTVSAIPATFGSRPCVVMRPQATANGAGVGFYLLEWDGGVSTLKIQKATWVGAAPPSQVNLLDTGVTAAVNDVLRLEARNAAGTWTLTAKKNGTVIGTTTDSSTIIQGMPAYFLGLAGTETLTMTEFAAGVV